jgi:hypothetical protein
MRTDDLICMMAKNPPCSCAKRAAIIWGSVAVLFALLVAAVFFTLGVRTGIQNVFDDPAMLFKYSFLAAALVGSGIGWWRSGHPGRCCKLPFYGMIGLGTFLVFDAGYALYTQGPANVAPQVFDGSAGMCVISIAVFAAIAAAVLVLVSKCMAPVNACLHACMTAIFASSLGALAYGLHCSHDHPAYLALWYGGTALAFTLIALPIIRKRQSW